MRDQELIGLYEAYQQVHTQQRLINEEVEIASHYFCEMGLNEIGVEILIEELGVEEFAEFVYDISEDYYLTEARAGGVKIEPVTTKGKQFKGGKPTGKSLERLRNKKKERQEGEASERPSGMKAALQRQDAMVSASKQQPKKKGLLDRVAGAVLKGIERHKAATDGMGAATRETAGKIGKAAGEFRRGLMSSYDNWVGQLISDGYDLSNWTDEGLFEYYEQLCEESLEKGQSPTPGGKKPVTSAIPPKPPKGTQVNTGYEESYDIVFEYLISEGYADTNENALVIMANMSEDWKQSIVEVTGRGRIDPIGNTQNYGYGPGYMPNTSSGIGERNSRTPEDAGLRMSPLDRAKAKANSLKKRDDPESTKRANRINSRFVNPTERAFQRSMLAAANVGVALRRKSKQDKAKG